MLTNDEFWTKIALEIEMTFLDTDTSKQMLCHNINCDDCPIRCAHKHNRPQHNLQIRLFNVELKKRQKRYLKVAAWRNLTDADIT